MNLTDLKLIFRSFRKDKLFFGINLLGMTAGILVTLLTGYYVYYKLSYDRFPKDHDRIYRIDYIMHYTGNEMHYSKCSESLANIMQEKVPGIKDILTLMKVPLTLELECEGHQIDLEKAILVNQDFLEYYQIDLITADNDVSEYDSSDLLITESFAHKHFGSVDPIGKELRFPSQNQVRFIIRGVIKDLPANSHILADAISFDPDIKQVANDEDDYAPENLTLFYKNIFLVLEKNTAIDDILASYLEIKKEYMQDYLDENGFDLELTATNIADTHFSEDIDHNFNTFPTENIRSVYYFLMLSILVIIVSIINFINLSLARYAERIKEIGVKRTLGALPGGIFFVFFLESTLQVLFSFCMGFIAFKLLLPEFSEFMGISLQNVAFSNNVYGILSGFLLMIILLSSLIPAVSSSIRNPIDILRKKTSLGNYKGRPVFFVQVILTIVILTVTIIMMLQIKFIDQTDKGYDIDNILAYEFHNWGPDQPESPEICERLKTSAYIQEIAVSTKLPGQDLNKGLINLEFEGDLHQIDCSFFMIDSNYLPFMGINLLAGENYRSELFPDTTHAIVNEAFIRGILSPEEALGARVFFPKAKEEDQKNEAEIIGIVSDFHFQTLHNKVTPMILLNSRFAPNYFHIRYNKKNFKHVLEYADSVFDELGGANIFSAKRHFPAEELLKKYELENHLEQITLWLSLLSIFLTIFGLFSITAYNVKKDMKSLCIRMVFGAEQADIFKYLVRFYAVALVAADLIAVFLSWYIGTKWLERFAYRIDLSIWIFIPGLIISCFILVIAIIYHVLDINRTNPADILQYE